MAGKGPLPKDPATRQRRNRRPPSTVLGPTPADMPVPHLRVHDPERAWDERTRRWWRAIWQSPMATRFLATDREALGSLAILKDMFFKSPTSALSAEIRLQETRFGFAAGDRARLDWVVQFPEVQPPTPLAARTKTGVDPRLTLLEGGKAG